MGTLSGERKLRPGRPWPLGAHCEGTGINFALFSAHAERVELCLFDPRGRREIGRIASAALHLASLREMAGV